MPKRRITLIDPKFQLKFMAIFLSISLCCMLFQLALLLNSFNAIPISTIRETLSFSQVAKEIILKNFFLTLGVLIPFTISVGVFVTFRIAGPIYRFRKYLMSLRDGEDPGPCRIRERDEFHDICELLNQVVETRIRKAIASQPSASPAVPNSPPVSREDVVEQG